MTNYFEELHKVYYRASEVNSAMRGVKSLETAEEKFKTQVFVSKNHQAIEKEKLFATRDKAEDDARKLERRHREAVENPNNILSQVTRRIIEKPDVKIHIPQVVLDIQPPKSKPNLNRQERKLVYIILDVIRENTDTKKFSEIQSKIIEAVNK